jgi:hypothetical protein
MRRRMRTKNIFDPRGIQEMLYKVVILMISSEIHPGVIDRVYILGCMILPGHPMENYDLGVNGNA